MTAGSTLLEQVVIHPALAAIREPALARRRTAAAGRGARKARRALADRPMMSVITELSMLSPSHLLQSLDMAAALAHQLFAGV
jgi:hypothetical protein